MSTQDNTTTENNGEKNGMPISYSYETLPVALESEMRQCYLDYAMSVIVGRALPDNHAHRVIKVTLITR